MNMRLDKLLAHAGFGTRSEVKQLLKRASVLVDGRAAKDGGMRIDPERNKVTVDGEAVRYREFIYIILNKPQGVVSATEDNRDRTVVDLLSAEDRRLEPFPVGRLDKDTEGLLLLTNDGKLAHNLLSPRKHVAKTYYAEVDGLVGDADKTAFAHGVTLEDGYVTMPAELQVLDVQGDRSRVLLTIREGKFHQVKRMIEAVGKRVVYLQRRTMGPLSLDDTLALGQYRELTGDELRLLEQYR